MINPRKGKILFKFYLDKNEISIIEKTSKSNDIGDLDLAEVGDIIVTAIKRGDKVN